jgi:hypothetical protein
VGRSYDDVRTFQVVGVLVGEAGGLDHSGRTGEIPETEFRSYGEHTQDTDMRHLSQESNHFLLVGHFIDDETFVTARQQ